MTNNGEELNVTWECVQPPPPTVMHATMAIIIWILLKMNGKLECKKNVQKVKENVNHVTNVKM